MFLDFTHLKPERGPKLIETICKESKLKSNVFHYLFSYLYHQVGMALKTPFIPIILELFHSQLFILPSVSLTCKFSINLPKACHSVWLIHLTFFFFK